MTTIVLRNGILAADTRAYSGDRMPIGEKSKIHRIDEEAGCLCFGISTPHPGFSEEIARWFYNDKHPDFEPHLNGRGFCALEIDEHGHVYFYNDSFVPAGPLTAEFYTIGSGAEFAQGALEMGADAITAVAVASKHDQWTGGRIEYVETALFEGETKGEDDPETAADAA